jgi:hypothetical protein
LTARPTTERERDYYDHIFGDAFLLQFSCGHTGLQTDPVMIELQEKTIQKCDEVFQNYFNTESHVVKLLYSILSSKGHNLPADTDLVQHEKYRKHCNGEIEWDHVSR